MPAGDTAASGFSRSWLACSASRDRRRRPRRSPDAMLATVGLTAEAQTPIRNALGGATKSWWRSRQAFLGLAAGRAARRADVGARPLGPAAACAPSCGSGATPARRSCIASHNLSEIEALCDRVAVIAEGRLRRARSARRRSVPKRIAVRFDLGLGRDTERSSFASSPVCRQLGRRSGWPLVLRSRFDRARPRWSRRLPTCSGLLTRLPHRRFAGLCAAPSWSRSLTELVGRE